MVLHMNLHAVGSRAVPSIWVRLLALALCCSLLLHESLAAQVRLSGRVVWGETSLPLLGAKIEAVGSRVSARSDSTGHFSLSVSQFPELLIARAVGAQPESLTVREASADAIELRLHRAPAFIPDLVATFPRLRGDGVELSSRAIEVSPLAVEPDALRALAIAPQVSFSSFLSARPSIRGSDSDDLSMTIDGIEAINLFHIGRYISAFPPLAVGAVRVVAQPATVDVGKTLSGRVEIDGKIAEGGPSILAQYGLGMTSIAASLPGQVGVVAAVRTAAGAPLGVATDLGGLRFSLRDAYLHLTTSLRGSSVRGTLFSSGDEFVNNDDTGFLRWSNLLLGVESDITVSRFLSLRPKISFSQHTETAGGIDARSGKTAVRNSFRRAGVALAGRISNLGLGSEISIGGGLAVRSVINQITPDIRAAIPERNYRDDSPEFDFYLEGNRRIGKASVGLGIRLDGEAKQVRWQPRLSLSLPVTAQSQVVWSLRRAVRLHHLVSDARTDPKLAYYDYWLPGGEAGIPVAEATVSSIGFRSGSPAFRWGLSAYTSRGAGSVELMPSELVTRQPATFRAGRSRTNGVELDASIGSPETGSGLAAAYAFITADRNWGRGWVPASIDKRHRLRLLASTNLARSVILSGRGVVESASPYTPIVGWDVQGDQAAVARYGPENSARGTWNVRLDASVLYAFRGPFESRLELGGSISNLSIGDQSPREAELSYWGPLHIATAPILTLPPIPSILIRGWFGVGNRLGGKSPY